MSDSTFQNKLWISIRIKDVFFINYWFFLSSYVLFCCQIFKKNSCVCLSLTLTAFAKANIATNKPNIFWLWVIILKEEFKNILTIKNQQINKLIKLFTVYYFFLWETLKALGINTLWTLETPNTDWFGISRVYCTKPFEFCLWLMKEREKEKREISFCTFLGLVLLNKPVL